MPEPERVISLHILSCRVISCQFVLEVSFRTRVFWPAWKGVKVSRKLRDAVPSLNRTLSHTTNYWEYKFGGMINIIEWANALVPPTPFKGGGLGASLKARKKRWLWLE